MFQCPQHHQSESADYCSVCGCQIETAPAAAADASTEKCPQCQAVRESQTQIFCEVCGFNFQTKQPGVPVAAAAVDSVAESPAVATSQIGGAVSKVAAVKWELRISVDPALYGEPNPDAPTDRPVQTFTLFETENIVGRAAPGVRVQIPISHDAGLSRRHALLKKSTDGLSIRDLGSANGTLLNGVELISGVEAPLKDGDVLGMGAWTKITIKAVTS
jgi:hypothetical protein